MPSGKRDATPRRIVNWRQRWKNRRAIDLLAKWLGLPKLGWCMREKPRA